MKWVIGSWAIAKGSIVAITAAALDLAFWKAVILAFVTGLLGALGAIVAAYIAAKEARINREITRDIKRKLGANKRAEDDD